MFQLQKSDYDSLLYPKGITSNQTVLPNFKDSAIGTHISQFESKSFGGSTRKKQRKYKIGKTIIRKNKSRRFRKSIRRKRNSRRNM